MPKLDAKAKNVRRTLAKAASVPSQTKIAQPAQKGKVGAPITSRVAAGAQPQTQAADGTQMNPPLPFGFMSGNVRIYYLTRKLLKSGANQGTEALYAYFYPLDNPNNKQKQSFVKPEYMEVIEQLEFPANYMISYANVNGVQVLSAAPLG